MRKRAELVQTANESPEARIYVKELCRRDVKFFIDHFAWTYDPRADIDNRHRPFVLYEFQEDEIDAIENAYVKGENLLIEKSRDMGVSWMYATWIYHKWLFEKDFNALVGSRKEAYVDNRQVDSLFGKLDYLMRFSPEWLIPKGFKIKEHRLNLKLVNPVNGNSIQGESSNTEFSRGGRYSVVFFDELAFWEWADKAWAAAGDATKCRFAVSTPNGANFFKTLRFSGKILVRTIHWKLHPEKDDDWYRAQCAGRLPEEIAQELDINYERSQAGRVYDEFENVIFGNHPYNDRLPLYVSWDYGLSDDTAMIWWQRDLMTGQRIIIDAYWNTGKLIDFYVPFVTGELPSATHPLYHYNYDDLEVIEEHNGWKAAIHYGDPSGKQRTQSGGNRSVIDILREYGIHTHTSDQSNRFEIRRTKAKLLMRDLVVNDNARTRYLRECMVSAHYPERKMNSSATTAPVKPVHDWTSHLRTSFEYYAVNERDYRPRRAIDEKRFSKTSFNGRGNSSTIMY